MRPAFPLSFALLLTGSAGLVLNGAGQSVMGPALPGYIRQFGLTAASGSLLISVFWLGALAGVASLILWPGRLSARWSFAALALGAALMAAQPNWPTVLLGAGVFGLGDGALSVIFNRRFLTEFGARGPSMVGLLNAIYCVGAIGGPLIFVTLGSNPPLTYALIAVLAAGIIPFASAGKTESRATSGPGRIRPAILLFGVTAIGFEAAAIGLGPTALIAEGVTEVKAAQLTSLFFAAYLGIRVLSIWLAPLVNPFTLFTLSIALSGASALAAGIAYPGLFYILCGASVSLVFPAYFIFAAQALGESPRTAATVMASGLIGGITIPLLIGPAMAASGGSAFGVMAALALGIAVLAAVNWRTLARPQQAAQT